MDSSAKNMGQVLGKLQQTPTNHQETHRRNSSIGRKAEGEGDEAEADHVRGVQRRLPALGLRGVSLPEAGLHGLRLGLSSASHLARLLGLGLGPGGAGEGGGRSPAEEGGRGRPPDGRGGDDGKHHRFAGFAGFVDEHRRGDVSG